MNRKVTVMALSLVMLWAQKARALDGEYDDNAHAGHVDHSSMDHSQAGGETVTKTDTEARTQPVDHQGMHHDDMPNSDQALEVDPHAGHDMTSMATATSKPMDHAQHDSVSMQGSSAPPDARDPHAYADAYEFGPIPPPIMADEAIFAALIADRLESLTTSDRTYLTYDWQAWLGKTYNRALIRAEGDIDDGSFQNARTELLWAHAAGANWDLHLGGRYDTGFGPDRGWLAVGVQGLAPYWIYVEATAYVGEQGRTAFRIETEYDILLTQKLTLQPRIEVNLYGKKDEARALGHGLSDLAIGVRLHYEIQRELAPYIGVEWAGKFGDTADYLKASGTRVDETRAIAGVQFWF